MSCIQSLSDGKLDIIGDIHGQYAALQALLAHLGYDDDGAHLLGRKAAQALVEFGQAGQCPLLGGLVELFVFVQPGGKAHHIFDGINDLQLPVVVGADLQAETVGAEVYRGQHIGGNGHIACVG